MPSDASLQKSKQAIAQILSILSICDVVYVDDVFDHGISVEEVTGLVAEALEATSEQVQRLIPTIPLDSPSEVWIQSLRDFWAGLQGDLRAKLAAELAVLCGHKVEDDVKIATKLRGLFPRKIRFHALSPSDWIDRRDRFLEAVTNQNRLLCLFDHDLSQADGFAPAGPRSGAGLIQALVNDTDKETVICGLVTHTIPSIEAEEIAWRELADKNHLSLNRFLPLAKARLADDASPLLFADGIKKTVLNLFCEELKIEALALLDAAHRAAKQRLEALDVYDFDYIVLRGSLSTGEWEIETLMRIWHLFQQDTVNELLLDSTNCEHLTHAIEIARPISYVPTEPNQNNFWNVRQIRRDELYGSTGSVRYTPLQLGDLFKLIDAPNGWHAHILLAQPCDLMVRKEGERTDGDISVPLAPVTDRITVEAASEKKETFFRKHALLHYLFANSDDVAVVDFSKSQWLSTNLLDLAVMDDSGNCAIDLLHLDTYRTALTVGWRIRIKYLIRWYQARQAELETIRTHLRSIDDTEIRNAVWQAVMPRVCMTDFGLRKAPYQHGVFDFGLRRIGRLRQPAADRLLRAYTVYLSRDAEAFDFYRHAG